MTQSQMRSAYHKELKALDNLAKVYKEAGIYDNSHHQTYIKNRKYAIWDMLEGNGANSKTVAKFMINYKNI
jgi:hypothetical protein